MSNVVKVRYIGPTSPLELTNDRTYDVLSIERGWYRITDDTGEDYLYPAQWFEPVKNVPECVLGNKLE